MRRTLAWLIGTLAAGALVASGFLAGGGQALIGGARPTPPAAAAAPTPRPVPVTTGTAEEKDFPIYRVGIGMVQA
jgi:hypothetical protein